MKTVDEFGRFGTVMAREERPPQQAVPAAGLAPPARSAMPAMPAMPEAPAPRASGWRAVLQLPLLRRSVILAEIIGQPRSLKGWEE